MIVVYTVLFWIVLFCYMYGKKQKREKRNREKMSGEIYEPTLKGMQDYYEDVGSAGTYKDWIKHVEDYYHKYPEEEAAEKVDAHCVK